MKATRGPVTENAMAPASSLLLAAAACTTIVSETDVVAVLTSVASLLRVGVGVVVVVVVVVDVVVVVVVVVVVATPAKRSGAFCKFRCLCARGQLNTGRLGCPPEF